MMGASEIAHFIRESSGAELPIIEDTNLTVSSSDKYISIGKTKVSDYYQFSCEQDKLGSKGYEIITKDKSILISGADQEVGFGNLYGAYEFLHHAVGYECYSETAIALDNSKDVALQDYKIWDKPDIEWRTANSGSTIYNSTLARRLRL